MAEPLSRTATLQWRCFVAPYGQGEKRPSSVLLALEAHNGKLWVDEQRHTGDVGLFC